MCTLLSANTSAHSGPWLVMGQVTKVNCGQRAVYEPSCHCQLSWRLVLAKVTLCYMGSRFFKNWDLLV